jgi:hypothetical protein
VENMRCTRGGQMGSTEIHLIHYGYSCDIVNVVLDLGFQVMSFKIQYYCCFLVL